MRLTRPSVGKRALTTVVLLVFSVTPQLAALEAATSVPSYEYPPMAVSPASPVVNLAVEECPMPPQTCSWLEFGVMFSTCMACSFSAAFCPILVAMAVWSGFAPHLVIMALLDCLAALALCWGCVAAAENCGDTERLLNAEEDIRRLEDLIRDLGEDPDNPNIDPPTTDGR